MSKKKFQRQNEIIEILKQSPAMRIRELAKKLNVTTETIRRDFDEMTDKGVLERTYGGAILQMPQEPGLNVRHHILVKERQEIAKMTVREIQGARHLMIGSGATTAQVARHIAAELSDLTVIAHSFAVAKELSHNPTIRVLMAPGTYSQSEEANNGAETAKFLEQYWVDYAIVGASGITAKGVTEAMIDSGEVYRSMMSRAVQTIVVADKSKYGLTYPSHFARWNEIDALITDAKAPKDIQDAIANSQCKYMSAVKEDK